MAIYQVLFNWETQDHKALRVGSAPEENKSVNTVYTTALSEGQAIKKALGSLLRVRQRELKQEAPFAGLIHAFYSGTEFKKYVQDLYFKHGLSPYDLQELFELYMNSEESWEESFKRLTLSQIKNKPSSYPTVMYLNISEHPTRYKTMSIRVVQYTSFKKAGIQLHGAWHLLSFYDTINLSRSLPYLVGLEVAIDKGMSPRKRA